MPRPPFFSIVVPTCDRPRQLAACLQSLARLDYPRDRFEVIVVDDGTTTAAPALVVEMKAGPDVRLVRQPHAGPAAARNLGASHARGSLLAFTDDDCAPAPDWLWALAARFEASPDAAIGGRTVNALPGNPYSTASQLLISYLYGYYNADPRRARFLASNNLAVPAVAFRRIGGFHAAWQRAAAEDRELCDRWLRRGHAMSYAVEAVVHHSHALTFRSFVRQHFTYGRGASWFHRLRRARGHGRLKLEPLRFYVDLVRHSFAQRSGARAPLLAALMVITQIANAAGYWWEGLAARASSVRTDLPATPPSVLVRDTRDARHE